jgi:hypothetical protein
LFFRKVGRSSHDIGHHTMLVIARYQPSNDV